MGGAAVGALSRRVRTAAALLTAAGLALAALPAAADEATTTTDDATLTWGISGYAQQGIFGPWRLTNPSAGVEILTGSVSGGSQTQYRVDPVPATSMPRSNPQKTPNAVRFSGGTGTVDASGATQLAWTGSYKVNAYPAELNAPDEVYSDPVLTLRADGSGNLTFHVAVSAGVDLQGRPSPARSLGRVAVLTFSAGSRAATATDTVRLTPDFQGVRVTPAGAPQETCTGNVWGSWPPEFVTAMPDSLQTHFYSTSCGGLQDNKPALPVDVVVPSADDEPSPTPTATAEPTATPAPTPTSSPKPGTLTWSFEDDAVSLGTAAVGADGSFTATGTLPAVTVTDTRRGSPGFTVAGRARPFATADGSASFGAQHLGWRPLLVEQVRGARAGKEIAPTTAAGGGLATSRALVVGTAGTASARVTAELSLRVPEGAAPGRYETVLTLTALG